MGEVVLPTAYPLSFREADGGYVYAAETFNGVEYLNKEEFLMWTHPEKLSSGEGADTVSLENKNLIIRAESKEELFVKLFQRVPIRQGFGTVNNNRHCLVLRKSLYYPSDIQMELWMDADGNKTMLEILRRLSWMRFWLL